MKKISLIFKDDADAEEWLREAKHPEASGDYFGYLTQKATIKVSKRKVKKGKAL